MQVIRDLFNSKKFVVSLVGAATMVAVKLGAPETNIEELLTVVAPFLAYIGAQGFADWGKEGR